MTKWIPHTPIESPRPFGPQSASLLRREGSEAAMQSNHTPRPRRTGTVLIVALVMMSFLLLLGAALTRSVFMFRQQSQAGERRQQALLLVESAIQRAARAVATKNDYSGETWRVPAEVLGNGNTGTVVIRVEKPAESASQRRLVIEAV